MNIVTQLSESYKFNESYLNSFIKSAPYRYKVYAIEKRKGGRRIIAQPSRELKIIQKLIANLFFAELPIHECAKAYKKNSNIFDNTSAHIESKYFLKMDFSNFFPSIKPNDFIKHVQKYGETEFNNDDLKVIENVFFYKNRKSNIQAKVLSIGAPTSPYISNTILYDFDSAITEICSEQNISYTRYADDLTFSSQNHGVLYKLPIIVQSIIDNLLYPNLTIHPDKTVFLSKRDNIHITGLVITSQNRISIGRKKKRYIKSLIFKFINNSLDLEKLPHLKGLLSFSNDVEPVFIESLRKKFGSEVIDRIIHFKI